MNGHVPNAEDPQGQRATHKVLTVSGLPTVLIVCSLWALDESDIEFDTSEAQSLQVGESRSPTRAWPRTAANCPASGYTSSTDTFFMIILQTNDT